MDFTILWLVIGILVIFILIELIILLTMFIIYSDKKIEKLDIKNALLEVPNNVKLNADNEQKLINYYWKLKGEQKNG